MTTTVGWIVLVGKGYPARNEDFDMTIAFFATEEAATTWVVEHPKAQHAYPVPLVTFAKETEQ